MATAQPRTALGEIAAPTSWIVSTGQVPLCAVLALCSPSFLMMVSLPADEPDFREQDDCAVAP